MKAISITIKAAFLDCQNVSADAIANSLVRIAADGLEAEVCFTTERRETIHDVPDIDFDNADGDDSIDRWHEKAHVLLAPPTGTTPDGIAALRELLNRYRPICCHNSEERNWHAPECPVPAAERAIALLEATPQQYDGQLLPSLTAAATRAADRAACIRTGAPGENPEDCTTREHETQQPEKAPEHCRTCDDSRYVPHPEKEKQDVYNVPCPDCTVLTPERIAWYLGHSAHCPFCFSANISGRQLDVQADTAWQPIACEDCNRDWNDLYKLSGLELTR